MGRQSLQGNCIWPLPFQAQGFPPILFDKGKQAEFVLHLFETVVRIADLLQVSLDELAGRSASITDPKIHNSELLNLYQQVAVCPMRRSKPWCW